MAEISEFKNLSSDELNEKLAHLKKSLMQYRFQAKTGKLERQSALREVKRDIARVLTVMNEQKKKDREVQK